MSLKKGSGGAPLRKKQAVRELLTDRQRDELIAFLRDWLPEEAKRVYRDMIRSSPNAWWYDPHFDGGIILEYALRGNGFTEKALGVTSLAPLWPDLLIRAVFDEAEKRADIDHA
jgi:hypothetical protein